MPLEDLVPLGFQVFRPDLDMEPPMPPVVAGYGRQWALQPGDDEEALVTEIKNFKTLHDKMQQAQTFFQDNYVNWGSMTAQQKDGANRQAQRALANLIRYVRDDLTSEGV
jgi:hypothetical protein